MSIRVDLPRLALRFLIAPVCLAAALVASAAAEVIVVSNHGDALSGGDGCSLREAIINANTDSKLGSIECPKGSGTDIILLPPSFISVGSSVLDDADAGSGDLDITADLVIIGGGQQYSVVDANGTGRLFDVAPGVTLSLSAFKMVNGYDSLAGGTIRVGGAGGELIATDIGISAPVIDPLELDGVGAGIYFAAGSTGQIVRSAFFGAEVSGNGAAIYCDGCALSVESTTFADNDAVESGGALYLANGSDVTLSYVTFGFNQAPVGAGIHSWGNLTLAATLVTDNGGAVAGDDLLCSGGSLAASDSFVEYPGGCGALPIAGIRTRVDLPPGAEADILRELQHQRFDAQPSFILQGRTALPVVDAFDCGAGSHRDQHGRWIGKTQNCQIGAFQLPVLTVNPMSYATTTNGVPFVIGFGLYGVTPSVDTTVRVSTISGPADVCGMATTDLVIPAGDDGTFVIIDPDTLFPVPELGRDKRVCEIEARILGGGDPALEGISTGVIRLLYNDTSLESASAVSSPAPGTFLDMGTVPVGTGGTSNISFRPASGGNWSITGAALNGVDPGRFTIDASFPILIDATGSKAFPLSCIGGQLGDFEALLEVYTDNPSFPVLVYGLRCRVAHMLTLQPASATVTEGGSITLTVSLDSPSILAAPFVVNVENVQGTAFVTGDGRIVEGSPDPALRQPDYNAFAGTVTFNPGEQTKTLVVSTIDDLVYLEGTETFGARLSFAPRTDVEFFQSYATSIRIDDDDVPDTGMTAVIAGMPSALAQGSQIDTVEVTVVNTSDVDYLGSVDISFAVDDPVRILSHVVARVDIPCSAQRVWMIENMTDPVALAAALAAFDPTCPVTLPEQTPVMVSSDDLAYNDAAKSLLQGAFCSVTDTQRAAVCKLSEPLPDKAVVVVRVVLEMAKMVQPPKLDYPGEVRVKARGRTLGAGGDVAGNAVVPYVIKGKDQSGGSLGLPFLLVAGLLAVRGRRKRSTGREAGGASSEVTS